MLTHATGPGLVQIPTGGFSQGFSLHIPPGNKEQNDLIPAGNSSSLWKQGIMSRKVPCTLQTSFARAVKKPARQGKAVGFVQHSQPGPGSIARSLLEPLLLPLPLLAAPQLPVFGRHHKTNCSNSSDATREWQLRRTGWLLVFGW